MVFVDKAKQACKIILLVLVKTAADVAADVRKVTEKASKKLEGKGTHTFIKQLYLKYLILSLEADELFSRIDHLKLNNTQVLCRDR